jgi:hypothetical protein
MAEETVMSFREKTRWAALAIDLLIWGWYFNRVAEVLPEGPADEMDFFWLAVGATVATIVIHVATQVLFAIQAPKEAGAALDERERAIEQRAGSAAYTLLAIGLVNVIVGSWFGWSKFMTVNGVLAVFVLAELFRYAHEILAYRRAGA